MLDWYGSYSCIMLLSRGTHVTVAFALLLASCFSRPRCQPEHHLRVMRQLLRYLFFFFNDTATTEIYTLSLHDALPISSPTARGLFEHAIAESGCLFPAPTRQQADKQGLTLAASLGCVRSATAGACLRAKPAAEILKAEAGMGWSPVIGAPTLPESPITAFLTGHYTHVPLLQGSNHDEGRFFVGVGFDVAQGHPMTRQQYPQVVAAQFGATNAKKILARYPLAHYRSPDLAYAAVFTDADFSCPALFAADFTQRSTVSAYNSRPPTPPHH